MPVSSFNVDDRTVQPVVDQANLKLPKTKKKETKIERGDPLCSDESEIPEWLQEFRENLVDDEIPLQGGSHASSSHEASLEPIIKRREDLGKHNVHTHFPKDRNCEICKRTKITRAPCRRRNGEAVPRAVNFGDLITADHKVLSDNCESRNNHRYAVVVQDLATQWIQAYPCKNKTSQETQRSLQKFLEPERKPKVIYTDNSFEFGKACEDLSWNHCTSTPHRSETNGIAERAVRRVKEGTSAVLLQSGLNESWWADSMECYTYLRNVTDLLSDGKTPYERRFGQPFKGPIIPFGSLVEYHPFTAKDQSRIHQFGKKVLPGLFLGYALYAGGIWKGDVLIADLEELETMDASEIYSKRLNAKEVIFPKEEDPEDKEFKETIKNARKKLETSMAPALPCKIMKKNCGSGGSNKIRTKLACILEADESTRLRMGNSLPSHHEDHIAGKGDHSLQHYNLVHKFIPMPQAMKIPAAKAAVVKEWEKLEKIPAWQLTTVRSKRDVIDEARKEGKTIHFASLMDLCHLKNAELEAKHQKYKGRVVLRDDIVKDDPSSYAVPSCPKLLQFYSRKSECPDNWIRVPRHKWPKSWSSMEDPVVPLERNLYGHPLAGLLWERQFEKILLKHGW